MLPVLTDTTSSAGSTLNTALQSNLAPSGILDQFVALLPWIGAMMLVAFVIYEGRRLTRGGAHGKVKA